MVLSVWYKGNPLREVVLEFCILKSQKKQQQKKTVPLWVYLNARYMVIDLVISLCWDWQMWDISQHPGRKVCKNKTKPHKQRTTTRNMKEKKKRHKNSKCPNTLFGLHHRFNWCCVESLSSAEFLLKMKCIPVTSFSYSYLVQWRW